MVAEARRLGLAASVLTITVERRTMAAARQARYAALVAYAREIQAGAIAVAHTATNQAETLLDRMLRGSGLRGLSAMAPVRAIAPGLQLLRPMLAVTSAEVEAYVAAKGLAVVRDPTNADPHYRRSRLRHEVLPLLRRERAGADRALAELAERLRQDAEALDEMARVAWLRLVVDDNHDGDGDDNALELRSGRTIEVEGLMALPVAVRARVLQRACPSPLEASTSRP